MRPIPQGGIPDGRCHLKDYGLLPIIKGLHVSIKLIQHTYENGYVLIGAFQLFQLQTLIFSSNALD